MKRFIISILLAGAAVMPLGAQSLWDAWNFAQNNYYGTARSVGLGNAVTAVGGDVGTVEFNPAGSAVAPYSQFVLTPAITVSISNIQGQKLSDSDDSPYCFQNRERSSRTAFKMPNFGFMLNMDTGRVRGIRNWTFGFLGHAQNNFSNNLLATGTNSETSLAGAMATASYGYTTDDLMMGANSTMDWFEGNAPWRSRLAYQSGIIDTYNGLASDYIGVTECLLDDGSIQLFDKINQEYGSRRRGNKYDLITNMAFNVSDRFFFGFNLGVVSLNYRSEEYWLEQEQTPFEIKYASGETSHFDYLRMRYSIDDDGSGIYAKTGFLWRVFGGLRLAAAIQTPTSYTITERYGFDAKTVYTENKYNTSASTPEDEWEYGFKSPWLFNLGLAYTLGDFALLTADYEQCDYSTMRFRSRGNVDFSSTNAEIAATMGKQQNFRAGAEVRVLPTVAVRAGYNYSTHPMKNYVNGDRSAVSFGLGYNSPGSFFADFALRMTYLPEEHLNIYEDYIYDAAGNLTAASPTVNINTTMVDALFTVGWRF